MKYRKWMSAASAAALLLAGMPSMPAAADEIVIEGEEQVPDEEMDPWAEGVAAGDFAEDEDDWSDAEFENQEDAGIGELIEDDYQEVVTVDEGADFQEVVTLESEADAAAEKIGELMDGVPVQLENASSERIREHLNRLTAQPSPIGSDGELEAAAYIEETMRSYGYTISEQSFHEGFLNDDFMDVPGVNIIAERGANSDMRTGDIVLICAHYDSKTNPDEADPLANDKTGTAVLMECARILSYVDSNVDLCFLFLSGEEDGYYGSTRLAEGLTDEIRGRIKCVIYVGPVGYMMQEETAQEEPLSEVTGESGTSETPAEEAQEVQEAGAHHGYVPPVLIGTLADEGSEAADLLQALAQYRQAEEALAGDALLQAGLAETVTAPPIGAPERTGYTRGEWDSLSQRWETLLAREQEELAGENADENAGGDQTDPSRQEKEEAIGKAKDALLTENLDMLAVLPVWTHVRGNLGFLDSFERSGMHAVALMQPLETDMMKKTDTLLVPVSREMESLAGSAQPADGQAAAGTEVAGAVGAEPVSDILLSAGMEGSQTGADAAGQAQGAADGAEEDAAESAASGRIIPAPDDAELAMITNYLSSAVSLYMRSQSSITLG